MIFLQRLLSIPYNARQLPGLAVAGVVLIGLLGSSCQRGEGATGATSYTDTQLDGYARSVLEIEPERQAAVKQIQELSGTEQVPAIACSETDSLDGHSEAIQEIAVDYCERAIEITQTNGLTIDEFNGITEELPQNPVLTEDVRARVRRIRDAESPGASSERPEEHS